MYIYIYINGHFWIKLVY